MTFAMQVLACSRHNNVVELNRLMGSPTAIHKHTITPHTMTKMNDNKNMDNTIAGSMNTRS